MQTTCRTGPTCRLHGTRSKEKQLIESIHELLTPARTLMSFPEGGKRGNSDEEIYEKLYHQARDVQAAAPGSSYDSIIAYRQVSSEPINAYLRGGVTALQQVITKPDLESYIEGTLKPRIKAIDGILVAHSKPVSMPLYRAVTIPKEDGNETTSLQHLKKLHQKGQTLNWNTYISTTASPEYLALHSKPGNHEVTIAYEIVDATGTPIMPEASQGYRHSPASIQEMEREVLIPRGSRFTVVNIRNITYENSYLEAGPHASTKRTIPTVQLRQT